MAASIDSPATSRRLDVLPNRTDDYTGLTRARVILEDYGWKEVLREYRWQLLAFALLVVAVASATAMVISLTSRSSTSRSSASSVPLQSYGAPLPAVPTNHVTGSGTATVQLRGDTATVTLTTNGLLAGSPHLAHIHGEGLGKCPTASSARLHNGHLSVSTGDGIRLYGPTLASFTEWGSTSGSVPNNIDMNRYPASGNIQYHRTLTLSRLTADLVRDGDAVIIVHGIDYNHNGVYDFGALGVSDLDRTLPGEATAPALCGPLRPSPNGQSASAQAATTYLASLTPDPASPPPVPGVVAPDAAQATRTRESGEALTSDEIALFCHLRAL